MNEDTACVVEVQGNDGRFAQSRRCTAAAAVGVVLKDALEFDQMGLEMGVFVVERASKQTRRGW